MGFRMLPQISFRFDGSHAPLGFGQDVSGRSASRS
jgi:hypothetical protein